MDGTLIDSERLWLEAEIELMARHGVVWTRADQEFCIGGPMRRVEKYLAMRAGGLHPPEYFGHCLNLMMVEKMKNGVDFALGAQELLLELTEEKIPMALVTASSRAIVDAAMKTIGEDTFAVTISGDDVKLGKPDPEGYVKAATELGVSISECIVLEDSLVGTTAALASGAVVVGISHVGTLAQSEKLTQVPNLRGFTVDRLASIFQQQRSIKLHS